MAFEHFASFVTLVAMAQSVLLYRSKCLTAPAQQLSSLKNTSHTYIRPFIRTDMCKRFVCGAGQGVLQPSYIVSCPCGVRHDDGAMMIECEDCKCWAHVHCLQLLVRLYE
jgi:hypothetical protein